MRALFVGLGGVGQRHLRNLRALRPDAEICAVRHAGRTFEIGNDLKADRSVDIIRKYDIRVFGSLVEASSYGVDFAIVANPSALHAQTGLELIEHDVPVFLEKPAATERAEFEALQRRGRERKVTVMVGLQLRWHPCVLRLHELLNEARVGDILSVEVAAHSYLPAWHDYELPHEFYAGRRALGGGAVLTEIHELDLLCRFFGRPARVFAVGGALGGTGLDVEDTYGAVLEFLDAAHRRFPATLSVSFVQRPPDRRFAVNGTRGKIALEIPTNRIVAVDCDGRETERIERSSFDRNQMFRAELEHFLGCLATGDEPATSLERIRDGQLAALAIRESIETERAIAQ